MEKLTAAHRTLPFQTWVHVTNLSNGLAVDVRITDRGPFVEGRIIDLSKAAARQIQLLGPGVGPVRLEVIHAPLTPPALEPVPSTPIRSAPGTAAANASTPSVPAPSPQPATPLVEAAPLARTAMPPDTIAGRNLYAVQVGVFAVYDNAVRLRDQYSKDYAQAQLVMRQGAPPTWRVLVGSFENEADARQLAERIHAERNQAVFVVHIDPVPLAVSAQK
jgi:rare lipoprotein A